MENNKINVLKKLDELQISYELFEHPALATIEEAMIFWNKIEATSCKNLFLRNNKGNRHFLIVLQHDTIFSLKLLKKKIENQHFSFASSERLKKYLNLLPGSVSPFGLLNDKDKKVELIFDLKLKNASYLLFHPNDNKATIKLSNQEFMNFLNYTEHKIRWINFSEL